MDQGLHRSVDLLAMEGAVEVVNRMLKKYSGSCAGLSRNL
jgi:hypothetical protein